MKRDLVKDEKTGHFEIQLEIKCDQCDRKNSLYFYHFRLPDEGGAVRKMKYALRCRHCGHTTLLKIEI